MTKRFLLMLLLCSLWLLPMPASADKDYHAESFDVQWNLTENGDLEVTETVAFRFDGGPFTFVYRDLPDEYSDGIEVISARLDGEPLPQGTAANQVEIDDDDPLKVTWHFPETSNTTRLFELKYRMLGVVRQEAGADLFWWNALPTDREYTIDSATVRLNYPRTLQPSIPPEVRRGTAEVTQTPGQIIWTARNIGDDAPLTLALAFPPGALISQPPQWQARAAAAEAAMPGFLGAAGIALVGGLAALGALWSRGRRQESAGGLVAGRTSNLPDGLPPALAGALLTDNGSATANNALGTLFDLGQRGLLAIEESSDKAWHQSREFDIRLLNPAPKGLRPHEQGLLALMFTDKRGRRDTAKMSEMGMRFTTRLNEFAAPLNQELRSAGLLDPQREAAAKGFMILGVVLLIAMAPLGVFAGVSIPRFGGWPFLLMGVAFVLAIVAFIMSATYSRLSDEGARAAARWRSFEAYLKDVIKGREPAWDLGLFDRYLPYAAAFGHAEGWTKAFQKHGGLKSPDWFRALTNSDDGGIAALVAMTASANSAGSSGGGGGGAGGGGGSGAG